MSPPTGLHEVLLADFPPHLRGLLLPTAVLLGQRVVKLRGLAQVFVHKTVGREENCLTCVVSHPDTAHRRNSTRLLPYMILKILVAQTSKLA